MFRTRAVIGGVLITLGLGVAAAVGGAQGDRSRSPATIVVKMVDVSATEYRFEPAEITVSPGDTVRFEQAGQMPHNVEFKEVPEGTSLGAAAMGPFLTTLGQTYDLVIDTRFVQGTHNFVCTPHATMGMTGTLTVH